MHQPQFARTVLLLPWRGMVAAVVVLVVVVRPSASSSSAQVGEGAAHDGRVAQQAQVAPTAA